MLRKIKRNIARNNMRKEGMEQLHKPPLKERKPKRSNKSKFAFEWKNYVRPTRME